MELSKKLVLQLCDLQTCSAPDALNSLNDSYQENFQSDEGNHITGSQPPDLKSVCSLRNSKLRNNNGIERILFKDKKLVVQVCDFMVCSKENCDVPEYTKYSKKEKIPDNKKRKTDKQYFHSRKKGIRYKDESSEEETSDVDKVFNGKEAQKHEEISDDDDISDIEEVSNDKEYSDSDEEEISDEDSDGSDWEYMNIAEKKKEKQKKIKEAQNQKKKEVKQNKKKEKDKKQTENLSNYELMRQKNLEDKMAFLKSLKMDELIEDLEDAAKSQTQRKPRVLKPKVILEVLRKSKRMENININLSEKALEAKVYESIPSEKPALPSIYSFEDAFYGDEERPLDDYDENFRNLKIKRAVSNTTSPSFLEGLDPMVFTSYTCPFLMTSSTFHPAVDRTIMLTGFNTGVVSLWNFNTEPYLFAPHTARVTLVKSNPECPSQMVSSSNDGTLRQTDIEKKCFVEIFKKDTQCKYFDFVSTSQFLVAQKDGCVSMVDSREKRSRSGVKVGTSIQWRCSEIQAIRTISAHPTKKDLCLSLDSLGTMKVWDLRFPKRSVSCDTSTDLTVFSAIFSPVTGNSILCSSKISVRIFDSSQIETKLKWQSKFDIYHTMNPGENPLNSGKTTNHYTMANWMPNCDGAFMVCNNFLRKVTILNSSDGKEMSSFKTPFVVSYQAVHPVHNMLVITNTSTHRSKIRVFTSKICT